MRRSIVSAWLLALGCGAPVEHATAVFAVGEVPPEVTTISVFVEGQGRSGVVASATVTAPRTRIALGVPAEVPLQITAVARSDRPAPESLGGTMPIYVGRVARTVPLGSEAFAVGLDVQPGGGLTVALEGPDEGGEQSLRLESAGTARPVSFGVPTRGGRLSQVLAEGRWRLVAEDPRWAVVGGEGLWVAAGVETRAALALVRAPDPRPPEAPRALGIEVLDVEGRALTGLVPTSTAAATPLVVRIFALDGTGAPVAVPPAEVQLEAIASPTSLLTAGVAEGAGLPARLGAWAAAGAGRLHFIARANIGEQALAVSWHANVGRAGGAPVTLALRLESPDRVTPGTRVLAALLDGEDRLAAVESWDLDAGGSDPWVYFPDGAELRVSGPVGALPLARPSAPAGLNLSVRAVATSTAFVGTSSASLALPGEPPAGRGSGGGG